jgi:LysM repeat protein
VFARDGDGPIRQRREEREMVLNQELAMAVRHCLRATAALSVIGLVSGCVSYSRDKAEAAAPAPVVAQPQAEAPAAPQNAIEAALAREAAGPATVADETANLTNVAVNATAPLSYTVKRGDTLWGISAMYLRDPWLWPEIWHVNPGISNPHLIFPGDQIALAYGANGEPQLRLVRGDAVRVSPLVRSEGLDGPIARIPYEAIQAFLGRPGIVSSEDLRRAPYVVGMRDRHIAAGADMQVYVKGLDRGTAGRYSIIHPGDELRDPDSGALLGHMGLYSATARIEPTGSGISRAFLLESSRETLRGDLVFPEDAKRAAEDIIPRAPPADIDGQIIGIVDDVQLVGTFHVVAINRGTDHGLTVGHVLAIDQRGDVVKDPGCGRARGSWCNNRSNVRLPDERAGTLLVFKTYDRLSFGLVVNATAEMRVADRVRAP